jgi:hypothetical protein
VPEGGITDDDIGDANVLNDVVAHPGHLKHSLSISKSTTTL